jgi:acyl-CoA hydrolase
MPADSNQYGDIFGGWLLGQMDIAGGIVASKAPGAAPRRSPSTR